MLDEDEWTDRNFGSSSLVLEENGCKVEAKNKEEVEPEVASTHGDTSEDEISDLDTDSESDEEEEGEDDDAGSRPLTSNEARQLQKEWIKRYVY